MSIVVYITFPEPIMAEKAAAILVSTHLAAGTNINGPVKSIYRWKGTIEVREEWQLFAQAALCDFERIRSLILEMHPYEIPCIMAFNIEAGHLPFLNWIERRGE